MVVGLLQCRHPRWLAFRHTFRASCPAAAATTMKRSVGLYIALLVVAGLLVFAAVERHPFSFYTLLRWICCPVFAYSAFAAHEKNRVVWVWICAANTPKIQTQTT